VSVFRVLHSACDRGRLLTAGPRLHLGSVKTPCEEWDPRVTVEPNFYYPQEDLLWSYCKRRGIGWNVVMPAAILGGNVLSRADFESAACPLLRR